VRPEDSDGEAPPISLPDEQEHGQRSELRSATGGRDHVACGARSGAISRDGEAESHDR
jgi:hypothetical protein